MQSGEPDKKDILRLMRYGYMIRSGEMVKALFEQDTWMTYDELRKAVARNGGDGSGVMIRTDIGIKLGLICYNKKSLSSRGVRLSEEGIRIYTSEDFNRYSIMVKMISGLFRDKELVEKAKRRHFEKTRYIS